jgi:AbiV family abortive infection protein
MIAKPDTTKQTLSPEGFEKLEGAVKAVPVLGNAFRLMTDADLLMRHERYSSALALAVLSIGEIGKYLFSAWSKGDPAFIYNRHKLHRMKQGAVTVLFMADRARRECNAAGVDFSDLGTPEKMAAFERAAKAGIDKESFLVGSAKSGIIETVKHSGLYHDDELAGKGIEPTKITEENATGIMQMCSRAFMTLMDERSVSLAKDFFSLLIHKPGEKTGGR